MATKYSSSKKARSDKAGAASEAKYSKVDNQKVTQFDDMNDYGDEDFDGFGDISQMKHKKGKRDHEIYKDTYYLPNDKLRLLEIPMNSSLTF
jgi:nucleosome binding factor SPN SPT16 subunit|tara:strand:+ start:63 stop:338 length:276 start_codon:yes stop_codon:yes gene_type:complete